MIFWRTLPSNAVAGDGDSWRCGGVGATLDVWFTADYRASWRLVLRLRPCAAVSPLKRRRVLVETLWLGNGRRDLSVWHRR